MSFQSMREMGKNFCPNFPQPYLENIDRRSCNDGSREFISVFHYPHLGAPYKGALLGRVEWEGEKNKLGSISK